MSKEYIDYKSLLNDITNETLKKRIDLSLKYYIDQAVFYKAFWIVLSILSIILPATATFIACFNKWEMLKWLLPLITSLTTIISSLLALFKCADKKTSYRNSAENLKSEISAFANKCSVYAKDTSNNESLLCERVEKIIKEGYAKIASLENDKNNEVKSKSSDNT